MIGPTADWSTGDGGDATALTTGGLLTGGTLDGNELGGSLADGADEAGDEGTLETAVLAALGAE